MGKFEEVINQIDSFIRKYYKNQMIKGFFLFTILFLSSFLIVTGLEYVGHFNSFIRGFLFFSFIFLNGYVLIKYFLLPLLKLFSFGKRINRFQAAKIIGDFFPNVNDQLLNTLQLENSSSYKENNIEFLKASIAQNSKQLNTFSFTKAIDYSANKKLLKYFLPILLTVVLCGIIFPNLYSSGTNRIVQFNQVFERAPDFSFQLKNKKLMVEEGGSLKVEVSIIPQPGKAIPNQIFLVTDRGTFLMKKATKNQASYLLKNLNNTIQFYFKAADAISNSYTLEVAKRTSFGRLNVTLHFPKYLNKEDKTIENPGDLIVPEGTRLTWNGVVKNAKSLTVTRKDTSIVFKDKVGFRFQYKAMQSSPLIFILKNAVLNNKDSTRYQVEVVKDEFPQIGLSRKKDSLRPKKIYFSGKVKDDYGLSRLTFTYTIDRKGAKPISKTVDVPGISGRQSPYSMTFDINQIPLQLNDQLTYFFTVYDNDGIHGSKATRSTVFKYSSPNLEELQDKRNEEKAESKSEMKDLIRQTQDFKENLSQLKEDVLQSKNTNYNQEQRIEKLQKQQEALLNQLKKVQKELENSFKEKNKLTPIDQEILQKKKELEKMFNAIKDKELEKLLKELEKLIKQNKNEQVLQKFKESELSAKEMKKQLEQTMEMLKQMDVEERIKDLQKSLLNLAKKQEELKKEIEKGLSEKKGVEKQKELNKKFNKLQEDLKKMLQLNKDLKRPFSLENLEKKSNTISKEMQGAKDKLSKGNEKEAGEKQKSASEKIQEMASQLQAQMRKSKQAQHQEDLKALRALLANLLKMSFDQEANMKAFQSTNIYDPHFVSLGKSQSDIIDNFRPVKDSLQALAERIPKISSFINQEVGELTKLYGYIPLHIDEQEKRYLLSKQQFAMTHLNNLALFLNQALKNTQKKMRSPIPGKGSCKTPGGKGKKGKKGKNGKMGLEGLKEMLRQQLKELKKGNKPGGNSPGNKPGSFLLPMNAQQAAQMAAQLKGIRRKIEQLKQRLNQDGSGTGNTLNKLLEELQEQERDLINRNWDKNLIKRQKKILTHFLQSEKAIRERGFSEERKSKSGKDVNYGNQIQFLEYKKEKEKQIELLKTLDPAFTEYYKEKANAYFMNMY